VGSPTSQKYKLVLSQVDSAVKRPDRIFITSAIAVALSTATFPYVPGYGTQLFQAVMLGAWSLIARLSSGQFADRHTGIVWVVTFLLNMIGFSSIGAPTWAIFRNRAPNFASILVISWTIFYVAMLFVLFPATTGP
jgi:hypothetical protein